MGKRILMIATGFLPYQFSENLCNAKLVYALRETGYEVDVISRRDEGCTYDSQWKPEWSSLRDLTYTVTYPVGNKLVRFLDVAYSGLYMDGNFINGVRWMRRAYQKARELMAEKHYDAVWTRSPSDLPHYVGKKLKEHTGIRWIANWNDPALPIWPEPYKTKLSPIHQKKEEDRIAALLNAADINTFPSDSLLKHFARHFPFLKESKTEVVPHIGLSECLFKRHKRFATDVMSMIHSGNMSEERNPENLFKAMRRLVDEGRAHFRLDIIGRPNSLTNALVERYKIKDYVRFIGSFTYLQSVEMLQDYDVMVLLEAIMEEGIFFASKTTDYALTGRPIFAVSPKKGFASDMISRYNAGIATDNTSVDSIYCGLKEMLTAYEAHSLDQYNSSKLYQAFAPEMVVRICDSLFSK